jgi:hypothetical protein
MDQYAGTKRRRSESHTEVSEIEETREVSENGLTKIEIMQAK